MQSLGTKEVAVRFKSMWRERLSGGEGQKVKLYFHEKNRTLWKKRIEVALEAKMRTLKLRAPAPATHFHPALELFPGAGVAAPATGTAESAAVAEWKGNGSSFVAQPVRTNRLAIERQAAH